MVPKPSVLSSVTPVTPPASPVEPPITTIKSFRTGVAVTALFDAVPAVVFHRLPADVNAATYTLPSPSCPTTSGTWVVSGPESQNHVGVPGKSAIFGSLLKPAIVFALASVRVPEPAANQ